MFLLIASMFQVIEEKVDAEPRPELGSIQELDVEASTARVELSEAACLTSQIFRNISHKFLN